MTFGEGVQAAAFGVTCNYRDAIVRLMKSVKSAATALTAAAAASAAPAVPVFAYWMPNIKHVLLALLLYAGQAVVWYIGQFYTLFLLTITLKMSYFPAYLPVLVAR